MGIAPSDDEAFASLIPMTDEEKATLEPMTDAFLMAATRFRTGATLDQHVTALDRAGYWGAQSLSAFDKRQHVRHKLETLTGPPRNNTDEIVDWIREHHPGAPLLMTEEMLGAVAHKASEDQWHPAQLNEALAIRAAEVKESGDDSA